MFPAAHLKSVVEEDEAATADDDDPSTPEQTEQASLTPTPVHPAEFLLAKQWKTGARPVSLDNLLAPDHHRKSRTNLLDDDTPEGALQPQSTQATASSAADPVVYARASSLDSFGNSLEELRGVLRSDSISAESGTKPVTKSEPSPRTQARLHDTPV